MRFPELPIEFYDIEVLKEIGSAIGPVLRIDSYTAIGSRGSYARLCIQIEINKPLITSICIGRMVQQVKYKGISTLCFSCGCFGHKQEIAKSKSLVREEEKFSNMNYGLGMLVTRRKSLVRNG